jgi:hypothetical protein
MISQYYQLYCLYIKLLLFGTLPFIWEENNRSTKINYAEQFLNHMVEI